MTPLGNSSYDLLPDAEPALTQAEVLCQQRGVRLTVLRRRVLEIIWSHVKPIGAYAILDTLRADGRQGAPPTVYRALEFLLEQGLIHRLTSLNGFAGCRQPGQRHEGQFLICQGCGHVNELRSPAVEDLLRAEAASCQFEVLTPIVEVLGRCSDCQQGTSSDAD